MTLGTYQHLAMFRQDIHFIWADHFSGTELNTNNWFIGMRNPDSGDVIPGADNPNNGSGDYLLNDKYVGYVTEEDSFVQDGSLILRNQKRSYSGKPFARFRLHFRLGYLHA